MSSKKMVLLIIALIWAIVAVIVMFANGPTIVVSLLGVVALVFVILSKRMDKKERKLNLEVERRRRMQKLDAEEAKIRASLEENNNN